MRKGKSMRSTSEQLSVSGLHSRTILDGIRRGFTRNKKQYFHYEPFESRWIPPGSAGSSAQTISDEMYTSPAMLDAHKEVQRLEIADSSCRLPRVVAAVMLGSDGLQLGAFSTKKAWVLYMWLGNLSKYERCKPNSGSCFELAHIPSLPDAIKDEITKLNGRPPPANLITHLRRELMHAVLHELLDAEFIHAWRHGIVISCADGIKRRVFPRLFTYAADYPESCGSDTVAEFNRRFRLVPTFSNSTIRKFSEDVASLKRLAARDFEDILQVRFYRFCLLPDSIDTQTQQLLFSLTRWHALAKLRQHTSATLRHLSAETTKLGDKMREFEAITAGLIVFETPREFRARQRRAAAKTQKQPHTNEPQTLTRKQCKLNLNTFKFHALGDYHRYCSEWYNRLVLNSSKLQHRKIKSQWFRTNKREAVLQMTKMGDIGDAIDVIQERLDKRTQSGASDESLLADCTNAEPYHIGQTDRTADAVNIPLWVHNQNRYNPATKFFITTLRQHLLSRITGDPEPTELGKITFQNDRMYSHATMRINYTSYDVRRQYDVVDPKSPCRYILLPSDTSDNPDAHTFLYARILGIYHANIRFCGRPPKRMDFLWVRWLDYDEAEPGGWDVERLDRLSYGKCRNDSELLDAFGFVDPQHVIRAAHLIPDFSSGTVGPTCFVPDSSRFVCDNDEGDWKYHYVNRFVDRDMMMRYVGGGIGHFNQYVAGSRNLVSKDINEEVDDSCSQEFVVTDEGNPNHHPESSDVDNGECTDEDNNDIPDVGSDEEDNVLLSDEEDFVDDLYDL
ncbi:colossin-A [Ceratobasidium sp. AG-Ba]|nr:colossin-A [Ceratobasidium sp. AG-Ba]